MEVFPYRKIIKQAYQLTKIHRILWLFGLFLFLAEVPFFISFYWFRQAPPINEAGGFLNLSAYPLPVLWLAGGLGILAFLVLAAVYFIAKAGMIQSVKILTEKRRRLVFREQIRAGREHFFRLLGVSASIWASLLFGSAVLFVPVAYLATVSTEKAWYLGSLAAVIFIPLLVIGLFMSILAPMFVVLFNLKTNTSLKATFDLLAANWLVVLLLGAFLRLVSLTAFFSTLFVMILITAPVAFLARLSYDMVGQTGVNAIYTVLGLGLAAIFLTVQAAISAFNHSAWVLAFLEIVKPKKSSAEEEEAAVIPEMISGG